MSSGNPGYSPLPQSNSDSDGSEEELHVSRENKFNNRPVDVQISKSAKAITELKKNVVNYKPLDDDRHVEETFMKFQSSVDEVFIQKSNSSEKFSTCRKICFVFSLFLCVFTTVAFVWVLPCNIESCPVTEDMKSLVASNAKNYNYTWKKFFFNLEIIGPCNLVSDSFSRNQNLVFLARSYFISVQNYTENFLLSLKGEDGSLSWRVKIERKPAVIDCSLIDIDLDGLNDCLLFGKNYITTINSMTGKEIWSNHNNLKSIKLIFLNFPIVLPDVDYDRVKDLLLSYSDTNNNKKYIAIVSGKTGKPIGEPFQIRFCKEFLNLMILNGASVFVTCHNFTSETVHTVNLMDVFRSNWTVSKKKGNFSHWKELKQHEKYSNKVFVSGLQLILKNRGFCPEKCSVFVSIKNEHKNSNNNSIYTVNKKNTFGMTPVKFKSQHTSGFILKFWEWNEETETIYFQNYTVQAKLNFSKFEISTRQTQRKNKNLNAATTDLDKEMLWESNQSVKRDKRTVGHINRQKNGTNLRLIKETLVKVTFNDTHLVVNNLYNDEILQICQRPHVCHPDENKQIHSNLVACFNGHEQEKLVTFSSKIINSRINESWQMQSKIQMLNCE